MKKRFVVEIDIPEDHVDLWWDETGLQVFHDCIINALPQIDTRWIVIAEKSEDENFKSFINKQVAVRQSLTVIEPKSDMPTLPPRTQH